MVLIKQANNQKFADLQRGCTIINIGKSFSRFLIDEYA